MSDLSEQLRQTTPVVAERGGVHRLGSDGRRYLDFTSHRRHNEFLEYGYPAVPAADCRG